MSETINYSVLKGSVDLSKAMESCGKVAGQERTIAKLDGQVWENTVTQIMEDLDNNQFETGDISKEGIAAIRKYLFVAMEKAIYDAKIVIPETGLDRTGKTIVLLNDKTNTVKWSSWDKTRRIFSYLGDIAKVLAYDKGDVLYPETNKVAARCDILAICKAMAPALEHVKRLSAQLDTYLPLLEGTDKLEGYNQVSGLTVPGMDKEIEGASIILQLDRVITGASDDQKDAIRAALSAMASRHFTPTTA